MTAQPANTQRTGLISLFARHPTAANLLMTAMIVIGLFATMRMNTQFFPTVEVPAISVTVSWPGASASDVETNILNALEPELRFLADVEKVTSIGREGVGIITIEFFANADMQQALSSVEQAVAQVTTLPEESEEPVVKRTTFYEMVAKISVSGPFSEAAIKAFAKDIRDGLLDAGIDRVDMSGARDEEIWVDIREYDLRRLGITLADVSARIKEETRDLPSGTIDGELEVQLRALAERRTPEAIGQIEINPRATGEKILLKDIATIETRFEDGAIIGQQNGKPAIELTVQRTIAADTLKTMETLTKYVEKAKQTLPPTLEVDVYDIRGKFVQQRLGILIINGLEGLVLVLAVLFLFLNARVAFWVAAGIPVALLATLAVMYVSGQTINMISMFALIMMLGIIVDDAIVVGEHAATLQQNGLSPIDAAEGGAKRMLPPVFAATLTTQASFLPIFLVGDRIGDIMSAVPLVVMAVLVASLIECFFILPGHLGHGGSATKKPSKIRAGFDRIMNNFRDGPYRRFVTTTYEWRYTTVAVTIGSLIIAVGLMAGGRVPFNFFPSPESERINASVVFGPGTPIAEQREAMAVIGASLKTAENELTNGKDKIIVASFTTIGKSGRRAQGDNLAMVEVQLTPSEERNIRTVDVIKAWRKAVPPIPGVERIAIASRRHGPPGRDIDIRLLNAPMTVMKDAADEVKLALTGFPGLSAIDDDLSLGKQELVMELTPKGTALGFTTQSIGQQVRNAFEGAIATRFPREDEEITVRVRRMQEIGGLEALNKIYVKSPAGNSVPLTEVVSLRETQGFATIQRIDGKRTLSVTADVDTEVTEVKKVTEKLAETIMPEIAEKYGIDYEFSGRDEERRNAFADLKIGITVALIMIYIILAWVFESYAKPLAVMSIIPFGFVGAIFGHLVMGFPITIISMLGLLGLSGILVNDSIILVSQVKERLKLGDNLHDAAIGASQDRLRAVILTSLTTIGGLLPLLFETSRQAQFLIPMAITMVFGLAAATILVLVLVPALVGVGGDISRSFKFIYGKDDEKIAATPASSS